MHALRSLLFAALSSGVFLLVLQPGCDEEPEEEPFVPADCAPGSGGCIADCAPGNSKGIGKACKRSGGQCQAFDGGPLIYLCTADFDTDPTIPMFCTTFCGNDADCGEGASCVHASIGSGCVPNVCIPADFDAGPVDAGPQDAGPGDAGPADAGDAGTS